MRDCTARPGLDLLGAVCPEGDGERIASTGKPHHSTLPAAKQIIPPIHTRLAAAFDMSQTNSPSDILQLSIQRPHSASHILAILHG